LDRLPVHTILEDLARVTQPIEEARGLPNYAYTSEDFARFERDNLLARTWTCIGVGAWVPEAGDVRPVELQGMPLILLRDQEGQIKVFHNVCSHRGLKLVTKPGKLGKALRCPYHSWTYDLEGRLRATPHVGGPGQHRCAGFSREGNGLKAVRTGVWMDMIFVNLSGDAPAFEEHIAPLANRWHMADQGLIRHGGADSRLGFDLRCNWKLAVENYCEAYHLPWIHPSLNSYSRLEDHYNIEIEGVGSGQGTQVYNPMLSNDGETFPSFPRWPSDWHKRAEYIAFYPNVLVGIHADHFYAVIIEPLGAGRTREHFEIYYIGDEPLGPDYEKLRKANAETWRGVFAEDQGVVEGMQEGRASPGFEGGVFSPVMDGPTLCFHRWAARTLRASLDHFEEENVVAFEAEAGIRP
jgi:choline monooxygenase